MSIQSPAKCEIIKTAYGHKAMNRTSVFKWCREFKNGRTSVHDDQRSGRPSILIEKIATPLEHTPTIHSFITICSFYLIINLNRSFFLPNEITDDAAYFALDGRLN
ncbi:hypothetical protein ALC60_02022 [Trachymyrmex zeteki]|uniref:Mos1 transposase HTH domain-containing protein n=1 Tax=Mycetomoellerius zeteki TaxID=64791 RepID=A0A151XFA9_9HYME|nr:hypothetical protein ALC60_02022 [Trachymyrmex zeteki]